MPFKQPMTPASCYLEYQRFLGVEYLMGMEMKRDLSGDMLIAMSDFARSIFLIKNKRKWTGSVKRGE